MGQGGREGEQESDQPSWKTPTPQGQGRRKRQVTHFLLSFSVFVLQGEEVQICHLQLCLAGFKKTANVPVDTCAWSGVDHVGRER